MEGKKKTTRKSYTAALKKEAILYADQHGNRSAARNYGIDESLVRDWKRHRATLFKCERARRANRGKKQKYPEIEEEISKFILEKRQNGLYVSRDMIHTKALELAKIRKIPRSAFRASRGWVTRFMKRKGFSIRRRTSISQKLPQDFEQKLVNYQRYVIALRKRQNFLLGHIGNADETPIWFDMPSSTTVTKQGSKEVVLKTTGYEKHRVTAMLAATADGRKLPPYLIFKRKTVPKPKKNEEQFPPGVVVRANENGWMTEDGMIDWTKTVWNNRPGAALQLPSLLALDAFRGHLTPKVKSTMQGLKTELVVIPGGMTSVLQPMDVSINKPVKDRVKRLYYEWLSRPNLPKTPAGKIKRASPMTVANWIKKAWDSLPEKVIVRSFKKCCLSNALDGTEDDILWEDSSDDDDPDYQRETGLEDSVEDSSSSNEHDDDSEEELVEESEDED